MGQILWDAKSGSSVKIYGIDSSFAETIWNEAVMLARYMQFRNIICIDQNLMMYYRPQKFVPLLIKHETAGGRLMIGFNFSGIQLVSRVQILKATYNWWLFLGTNVATA